MSRRKLLRTLHLFAGMGGSHLAAQFLPWKSVGSVERDETCREILGAHYPGEPVHDDVCTFDGTGLDVDLVVMGFPCTDLSVAGRGKGLKGKASGLFFDGLRIAAEAQAPLLFIENVLGFLSNKGGKSFEVCLRALQAMGYGDVRWTSNRASDVGAPFHRGRVWLLARWTGVPVEGKWRRPKRWPVKGIVSGDTLTVLQEKLPTPEKDPTRWGAMRASDDRGTGSLGSKSHATHLQKGYLTAHAQHSNQESGVLNPAWCEVLMGWPMGYTAGDPIRKWPAAEGKWPAPRGPAQYKWEPPRLLPKTKPGQKGDPMRGRRIRALGNGWVPTQAVAAWEELTAP